MNCRYRPFCGKRTEANKKREIMFSLVSVSHAYTSPHTRSRRGEATCSGRPGSISAVVNMHTHTATQLRLVKINLDPAYNHSEIVQNVVRATQLLFARFDFFVLFSLVSGRFLLASQRQSVAVLRRPLPRTKLSSRAAEAMRGEKTHQRARARPKKQQ